MRLLQVGNRFINLDLMTDAKYIPAKSEPEKPSKLRLHHLTTDPRVFGEEIFWGAEADAVYSILYQIADQTPFLAPFDFLKLQNGA